MYVRVHTVVIDSLPRDTCVYMYVWASFLSLADIRYDALHNQCGEAVRRGHSEGPPPISPSSAHASVTSFGQPHLNDNCGGNARALFCNE